MGSMDCLYPNNGSNYRPVDDDDDDFSFSSCQNFGSNYLEALSEEEEGDLLYDSADESYIEIQLQHSKTSSRDNFPYPDLDDDDDEHIELRISISSTAVPFPQRFIAASTESEAETSTTSLNSSSMSSISLPGFEKGGYSNQGKEVLKASEEALSKLRHQGDDIKGRRTRTRNKSRIVQFPAINRMLTALLSSLKVSPEICQETPACSNPSISNLEMLRTKKNFRTASSSSSSRNSTTTNGNIMMNFLIKLRATQIGTFLTSFMKSRQAVPPPGKNSKGSEKKNKHEASFQFYTKTPKGKGNNEKKRKPKLSVLEIDLNGVKGVIEAVRIGRKSESSNKETKKKMQKDSNSSNSSKSKSCPTSSKSSPLHRDGKVHLGESSIQAAIAHCKNSFPFFPDVRFDPITAHP